MILDIMRKTTRNKRKVALDKNFALDVLERLKLHRAERGLIWAVKAPVEIPLIKQKGRKILLLTNETKKSGRYIRSLRILASTPHDHICRAGLRPLVLPVHGVASCSLLEKAHSSRCHAAQIATGVTGNDAQQALAGLFGKIWLLENTLGAVDVRKVEGGPGVAGVEDGSEAHTWLQWLNHDTVHLVVYDVTCLAEINGVDHLIVAVLFVAVQIFGLSSVS